MSSPFKTLIVLDFETTCEEGLYDFPSEVIQFSVKAINVKYQQILTMTVFDEFVRPVINPVLSEYCTKLTGIRQQDVDDAKTFPMIFRDFREFLHSHCFKEGEFLVVCDSSQDLQRIAQLQFFYCGLTLPSFFRNYCNLHRIFLSDVEKKGTEGKVLPERGNLEKMCMYYDVVRAQPAHNALADCHTLAEIAVKMLKEGLTITVNEQMCCTAKWRYNTDFEAAPTWRHDFFEAEKVILRFLPLTSHKLNQGFYDMAYFNRCRVCKQPPEYCGLKHRQYPQLLFLQLKDTLEFAKPANYFK